MKYIIKSFGSLLSNTEPISASGHLLFISSSLPTVYSFCISYNSFSCCYIFFSNVIFDSPYFDFQICHLFGHLIIPRTHMKRWVFVLFWFLFCGRKSKEHRLWNQQTWSCNPAPPLWLLILPWISCWIFMRLAFFICKMEIPVIAFLWSCKDEICKGYICNITYP